MRRHFALPLALLFIAFGVPSNAETEAPLPAAAATKSEAPSADAFNVLHYELPLSFSVNCSLEPVDGESYVWFKNNTLVEELEDLRDRYKVDKGGAVFRVERPSHENDYGNYTCSVGGVNQTYDVRARPHVKMPHNTNVVELQPLKISCKVTGKPYPTVTWLFKNTTLENQTEALAALGERASLRPNAQGVPNAELVLTEAWRSDAGEYTCVAEPGRNASTTLRVKDQYAALWPFLGICAEVFVLCAIILVYEKRRTKPELDDSDTDNHDQKKS